MPKKFYGMNQKSLIARNRKEVKKQEENEKKLKETEDLFWIDEKNNIKLQRKQEREKKKEEELQRRQERKALAEQEEQELTKKYGKPQQSKITQSTISKLYQESLLKENIALEEATNNIEESIDISPNPNIKISAEIQANDIDSAVMQLSLNEKEQTIDKHPEKRLKASFNAYKQSRFTQLKAENPSLKHTQLKQLLWNEWQKSSQNPMIQAKMKQQETFFREGKIG